MEVLPCRGPFGFLNTSQKSQVSVSYYSDAHDERQLECGSGKPRVDWPFVRHSVEQDRGARSVTELHHHQLLTIDDYGAARRWVVIIAAFSFYP